MSRFASLAAFLGLAKFPVPLIDRSLLAVKVHLTLSVAGFELFACGLTLLQGYPFRWPFYSLSVQFLRSVQRSKSPGHELSPHRQRCFCSTFLMFDGFLQLFGEPPTLSKFLLGQLCTLLFLMLLRICGISHVLCAVDGLHFLSLSTQSALLRLRGLTHVSHWVSVAWTSLQVPHFANFAQHKCEMPPQLSKEHLNRFLH